MGKHVYIDESGDESLQLHLPTISSFYVVCAVVIDPSKLVAARERFAEVKRRYFRNREMKSSGFENEVVRQQILQELTGVPFALHILVGNKSLVTSPGLRYPKSFIKYLHGFLYKELMKDYSGVEIWADKIKNRSFMDEMRSYLDRHNLFGLFEKSTFEFVDSEADVCVQAADFIGGSVRACFERNPQTAMCDPTMEKLRWHLSQFLPYPDSYGKYIAKIPGVGEHDQAIEARAVLEAENFLRKHSGDVTPDIELQLTAVRMLLTALTWSDDNWVATPTLMERLNVVATEPLNEQGFRAVIGKLRDEGVLIASRSIGGYKLATSMADMTEFLNRQNSQLAPMIERVRIARQTVRRATDNAVDILAPQEFQNLKAIMDAMPPWYGHTHDFPLPVEGAQQPIAARPLSEPELSYVLTHSDLVGASPAS